MCGGRASRQLGDDVCACLPARRPLCVQSALVSNLFFISQLLFKRYGGNILVRLLGTWQVRGAGLGWAGLALLYSLPGGVGQPPGSLVGRRMLGL